MADVELQEQTVPLKNAEQGAAEGAESAAGGESQQPAEGAAAEPKAKEKKGWFSKKVSQQLIQSQRNNFKIKIL